MSKFPGDDFPGDTFPGDTFQGDTFPGENFPLLSPTVSVPPVNPDSECDPSHDHRSYSRQPCRFWCPCSAARRRRRSAPQLSPRHSSGREQSNRYLLIFSTTPLSPCKKRIVSLFKGIAETAAGRGSLLLLTFQGSGGGWGFPSQIPM